MTRGNRIPIALVFIAAIALGLRLWMLHSYLPLSPWVAAQTLADAEMGRNLRAGRGWVANVEMLAKATAANNARNEMVDLQDLLPVDDSSPDLLINGGSAHSPGYSGWFAISYWLGGAARYRYSQVMQATLDAFGCILLFGIGRSLWSARAGLAAAAIYALWPAPAFLANLTVAAATDSFWFIAVAYGALTGWRQVEAGVTPWRGVTIVTLAAFGGACMNSTSFALPTAVAGVSVLAAIACDRRAWKFCAYMITAQLLVGALLTPWAFRNQRMFGQFTPVRGSFWQLAFAAFGELPNPWGLGFDDKYYWNWIAENCPTCSAGEREALARKYIVGTVVMSRAFPRFAVALIEWRLPVLIEVMRVPLGRFNEGGSTAARNTLSGFLSVADTVAPTLMIFAAIGMFLVWRQPDKRTGLMIAMAPTLFLTTFSLFFYVELRKTLPGFAFLSVPAGIAVTSLGAGLRSATGRAWGGVSARWVARSSR